MKILCLVHLLILLTGCATVDSHKNKIFQDADIAFRDLDFAKAEKILLNSRVKTFDMEVEIWGNGNIESGICSIYSYPTSKLLDALSFFKENFPTGTELQENNIDQIDAKIEYFEKKFKPLVDTNGGWGDENWKYVMPSGKTASCPREIVYPFYYMNNPIPARNKAKEYRDQQIDRLTGIRINIRQQKADQIAKERNKLLSNPRFLKCELLDKLQRRKNGYEYVDKQIKYFTRLYTTNRSPTYKEKEMINHLKLSRNITGEGIRNVQNKLLQYKNVHAKNCSQYSIYYQQNNQEQ